MKQNPGSEPWHSLSLQASALPNEANMHKAQAMQLATTKWRGLFYRLSRALTQVNLVPDVLYTLNSFVC